MTFEREENRQLLLEAIERITRVNKRLNICENKYDEQLNKAIGYIEEVADDLKTNKGD
jgi:hypothetical protein